MSDADDTSLEGESALAEVRQICETYSDSAENIGSGIFSDEIGLNDHEKRRYEEGRKKSLGIAIAVTDKVWRDTALQAALDFCMKAKDLDFAVMIVKAIDVRTIQEQIVKDHSDYFVLNEKDGRLVSTPATAIDPSLE